MNYLYAPWRSGYFISKNEECVFCAISQGMDLNIKLKMQTKSKERSKELKDSTSESTSCNQDKLMQADIKNRVFYRDNEVFCVMNKFPYTPGHFLIIPHTHTHSPEILDVEVWLQMQKIAQKGVALLKEFGAQGINLGMNIERAGGAGIPEHLHLHLIPRFIGDTNFFTTIGDSRAYGVDFDEIFNRICKLSQKYFY
ncbi:HIT domain-containing protein [uncultured Helicobacter sp.]|uniref:HIT family protein n=1 Tax=uncultured Helicobacter sp. TaxID=175537 RepID=UPI00260D26DE|nr:HIT domain-containing protein [uncultured Helicobacter sp.]